MKIGEIVESVDRSKLPGYITHPATEHAWVLDVDRNKWLYLKRSDELDRQSDFTMLTREDQDRDDWQITYHAALQ